MPRQKSGSLDAPYFSTLKEFDTWIAGPTNRKLDGILEYSARPKPQSGGKLLVSFPLVRFLPLQLIYLQGWITAAHRQGVKILGTLIFEGDGEEDCLRLLVGNLPSSVNGPAKPPSEATPLPLSPHYAKLLAELAWKRGFDGYLLNFECPLKGGIEQCRTLTAWITILQAEILARVASHGEIIWYDSVIFTGQLAWQDRLDSLNLPFFLSSSGLFTNYTWPREYPNITAEYFLALDPALIGTAPDSQPYVSPKSLNDIYMGVDVWGRGSHGGGGFGSYKAITHIAPQSLGLSVALFGQGWTWESEQDKPGWTWEQWWAYDTKLWFGTLPGDTVVVPEAPRRKGEPECPHGAFEPIASFFPRNPPPDPFDLPLHTTFSPGVGRAWFVNGVKVHQAPDGWTSVDKQGTVGDMVWPRPTALWEVNQCDEPFPDIRPTICFEDAWNGGNSLRLGLSFAGSSAEEDTMYRCVWVPIQSVSFKKGRLYEAVIIYKTDAPHHIDLDIGLSLKSISGDSLAESLELTPIPDIYLAESWSKLAIRFSAPKTQDPSLFVTGALGLVVAVISEEPSDAFELTIRLGQLNVYSVPPQNTAVYSPSILWADFVAPRTLTWEVSALFPPMSPVSVKSPEDAISAWTIYPSNNWFPKYMYFNIYVLPHNSGETVGQPEEATWLGTTGWDGIKNRFLVVPETLPFWPLATGTTRKVRFYIQGVTDRGEVLPWERSVFVDYDLSSLE
ncbi:hypothetical protein H0H81_004588 [Sphagnurus paluster]|uniref:Cytosolic endo-beta-N-acetylglucosaminidase TIM barrel domain-containing protein n=1 Tax=Sphagnurus paluster TaxID=117069 RepID=A0A9P7FUS6_9AGAR|nr:hypothetical protein H0H81_004588 [Sphagnurus paluster]